LLSIFCCYILLEHVFADDHPSSPAVIKAICSLNYRALFPTFDINSSFIPLSILTNFYQKNRQKTQAEKNSRLRSTKQQEKMENSDTKGRDLQTTTSEIADGGALAQQSATVCFRLFVRFLRRLFAFKTFSFVCFQTTNRKRGLNEDSEDDENQAAADRSLRNKKPSGR
jgi:hypothetical protein